MMGFRICRSQGLAALKEGSLRVSILTLTFARLVVNITRRFPYPFLNEISRQLGVPLSSVQGVMATNWGIGLASPFFGSLSERYGRKYVMLGSLSLMAAAAAVGALVSQFALFAAVMIVFGIGKIVYDPAMQAYLGDRVPFARRAMAIGITELSWAGSLLIAAPVGAFLLANFGLQSIFIALFILFLAAVVTVILLLPADYSQHHRTISIMPLQAWRVLTGHRTALGALGFSVLFSVANEIFLINYSTWMERSFQLPLSSLGIATIAIAAAEVGGEFGVIGIADRFGARRLTILAVFASALSYFLLPLLVVDVATALIGIFILFVFFEMAIVASIPVFTEIMPSARNIIMSGNVAAHATGRMLGALIGSSLLQTLGSFSAIGIVEMVLALCGLALLWRFTSDGGSFTR